jgi:hypothetical protein
MSAVLPIVVDVMSRSRTYSDDSLRQAVAISHSWRGVLRRLGLAATSSSAIRSVRGHADRLGLDHSHFMGQRRWTDGQLAQAIAVARTWHDVAASLRLAGGSSQTVLKGHAARLWLDTSQLEAPRRTQSFSVPATDMSNLRRAGSLMAAAWFTLCGCEVSWPLEPCRYDLLVSSPDGPLRVQVKTTTVRSGRSWTVWLSTTGKFRTTYDPDEIDLFFVIDGDLACYLIPVRDVGGLHAISLSSYEPYRLAGRWPCLAR